jgi:protein-S-isoprenylcysteine O-methyltransferase Ste14
MMFYFIYSVLIPVKLKSGAAVAGLIIYIAGFAVYASAWVVIASPGEGCLFKRGPFRYSRHPVYLSAAILFLGTGLMSNSIFFLGLSVVTALTHMHNAYGEEKNCIETFGDEYSTYMIQTPRWIGRPRV